MKQEIFLVKGVVKKKTGAMLKFLSQNNYSKVEHIKRVKNKSSNYNLVILEKIPQHFWTKGNINNNSILEIRSITAEWFLSQIDNLPNKQQFAKKIYPLFEYFENNDSLYVLKITRTAKNLVIN